MNEICFIEESGDVLLDNFKLKYCKYCYMVFSVDNCCVRLYFKCGKKKRFDDKKCCFNKEIFKFYWRLNYVGVFCKMCGKYLFYFGCVGDDKKFIFEKKILFFVLWNLYNNSINE